MTLSENLLKLYYILTAYIPRKLPTTEAEFVVFKDKLLKYYGLPDEPQTYAVISGQIQSTLGHKIRKSYGDIANNVKRLKINALAQCYKMAAHEEFKARLEKIQKESETSSQGQSDVEVLSIQRVQETQPSMEQEVKAEGVS
jgi:hypothetical protein